MTALEPLLQIQHISKSFGGLLVFTKDNIDPYNF